MLIGCVVTGDLSVANEPVVDLRLVLWLDAQDVTGSGGERNVSVDGASLTRWTDKSPHANHAVQPVAEGRPEYVTADADVPFDRVRFAKSRQQHLQIKHQPSLDLERLARKVDPRDRRCRIANRAMRMVYQLVGGRQLWRGQGVELCIRITSHKQQHS